MHWSYWSDEPTYYDRFAIGSWRKAFILGRGVERLDPYTLRLVSSKDILSHLEREISAPNIRWVPEQVKEVYAAADGYVVETDAGSYLSDWVFDSIPSLEPAFPDEDQPYAFVSGTGIRVRSNQDIFKPNIARLFEPLDQNTMVYTLPISKREALVESAYFSTETNGKSNGPLLEHVKALWPDIAFMITHSEHGVIPLGFAPSRTLGRHHILLGTKRGAVKPSAGFGIMRILHDANLLADRFMANLPLEPTASSGYPWRLMDTTFLKLLQKKPEAGWQLMTQSLQNLPASKNLALLDESIPSLQAHALMLRFLPMVLSSIAHDK